LDQVVEEEQVQQVEVHQDQLQEQVEQEQLIQLQVHQ